MFASGYFKRVHFILLISFWGISCSQQEHLAPEPETQIIEIDTTISIPTATVSRTLVSSNNTDSTDSVSPPENNIITPTVQSTIELSSETNTEVYQPNLDLDVVPENILKEMRFFAGGGGGLSSLLICDEEGREIIGAQETYEILTLNMLILCGNYTEDLSAELTYPNGKSESIGTYQVNSSFDLFRDLDTGDAIETYDSNRVEIDLPFPIDSPVGEYKLEIRDDAQNFIYVYRFKVINNQGEPKITYKDWFEVSKLFNNFNLYRPEKNNQLMIYNFHPNELVNIYEFTTSQSNYPWFTMQSRDVISVNSKGYQFIEIDETNLHSREYIAFGEFSGEARTSTPFISKFLLDTAQSYDEGMKGENFLPSYETQFWSFEGTHGLIEFAIESSFVFAFDYEIYSPDLKVVKPIDYISDYHTLYQLGEEGTHYILVANNRNSDFFYTMSVTGSGITSSGGKAEGQSFSCLGPLKTRLNEGMNARVTFTDGTRNRVRDEPVSGTILESIPEGTKMKIIGGPICENNLVWWKVSVETGTIGWTAEGDADEYWLEPAN